MYILLAIVGLVATVSAKDLIVGQEGGSLKYEQNITASPTIWRQVKNITFNVSESEVITQISIVDLREDKNGEAAIVEGGEGHKNVTIELKGPAVFRGFDFEVKVYAKQEDDIQTPVDDNQQTVQKPIQDTDVNDKQVPQKETKDVIIEAPVPTDSDTQVPKGQDKIQHPVVIAQEDNQQVRPNRDVQVQGIGQKPTKPTVGADWHKTVDDIFGEHKTVLKPENSSEETKKLAVEPLKPVENIDDSQQIAIDGEKQLKSSTDADDSQQAKKEVNVPLPYVKH